MGIRKNFFNTKETLYFGSEIAVDFGIISKEKITEKKDGYAVQVLSISDSRHRVEIKIKLDEKETKIVLKKKDITKLQNTFVAWAYLVLGEENFNLKKDYKGKASKYLEQAVKHTWEDEEENGENSPVPYFLMAKYDVEVRFVNNVRIELYKFFNKGKKLFRGFYEQLLAKEKNKVRKVMIAEKALEYYPKDETLLGVISSDLFEQERYADCANFLKEKKTILSAEEWLSMDYLRITFIRCLIREGLYENAVEELKNDISPFGSNYTNLLKGILYHSQKDYPQAIKAFEQVLMEDYTDNDTSIVATYYLAECYLINKDKVKLENLISSFSLQENQIFLFGIPLYKQEEILDIFSRLIASKDLDERIIAKIKAMYAYVLQEEIYYSPGSSKKQELTNKEKSIVEKCLTLLKESLLYYPDIVFINGLYSNLLEMKGDFDEAFDYKIRSLLKDDKNNTFYVSVELKKCTVQYMARYPARLKELITETEGSLANYVDPLGFDSDVGALWDLKMYKQIADLYKYVKPFISNFSKIGELREHTSGGGLFEVAYSLSEIGDIDECIFLYEKVVADDEENSSALNNLAIAYEKKGEKVKAKKYIKMARDLVENDALVDRNYKRLFSSTKTKIEDNSSKKEPEIPKTEVSLPITKIEGKTGYLVLSKEKIPIGPSANVPFKLLEALCPFGKPKGISAVFNMTNTERSKYKIAQPLSLLEKQAQLRLRLKELQEVLRVKRMKVSLVFNLQEETVFLEHHTRG